jgi:putative ABC transport system ATP-binding protein
LKHQPPLDFAVRALSLSKGYRDGGELRPVLEDLTFSLQPGEVLALTGPSGSGKSTVLNLLAGTLVADSGELEVATSAGLIALGSLDDAGRTRYRRAHVGYVFQFFNLVPTLTVRENVLLPLELNGRKDLTRTALERLATLGMQSRQDDFPENLSGGERQRTAIARALAHQPALVLADEPTGNLDAENAARVADMLISHVRAADSALVLATHDERVAARADQILRLGG